LLPSRCRCIGTIRRRNLRGLCGVLRRDRDNRPRLYSAFLLRRRLRAVLLQQRLEEHDDQKRQRKDHQQPALHSRFLLRIIKFSQISSSSFLRHSPHPNVETPGAPQHASPPDPDHLSPADGTAKPAKPPSLHRATHHTALSPPSHSPNTSARSGTTAETLAKSIVCKAVAPKAREASFLFIFLLQLFRDHIQRPAHFFEHHRKFQGQHRLLRIDPPVNRARALQHRTPQPHRLAQPPLDSVPLHRAAQHASHREPDARAFLRYSALRRSVFG